MDMLTVQAIQDAGLADWRKLAQRLHARFLVSSFADGLKFLTAIGETCAAAGTQPDVRVGASFVDLALASPDAVYRDPDGVEYVFPSVTQRDVELARRISAIAGSHGVQADPAGVVQLEIAIDTADPGRIGPFWAAVLTGSTDAMHGVDVGDPTDRIPNLWFQRTEPHETPRQRFHLDLWLPPELARTRIEAALAVGGTITYDAEAPAFTVLADPDGNKVCICTTESR
ncbi:VOC family protein [Kribbella sp. NPDC049227]|uniref:VOC family protein n=1 Tax=Kribbella sp. NPDC049227 TaxID=3364113 RepID=UPI003724532D